MQTALERIKGIEVALRKESVDRNKGSFRALAVLPVALRKESVDRNTSFPSSPTREYRRSPQGERG